MDSCDFGLIAGIIGFGVGAFSYLRTSIMTSRVKKLLSTPQYEALIVACSIIRRSRVAISKKEYDLLSNALGGRPDLVQEHWEREMGG
jgi:hypothetical protein